MLTITSDFGLKSFELAAIKAGILYEIPSATIVDISHEINPFDLNEAAYVIRHAYAHFPKSSVHLLLVDSAITPSQKAICAKIDGHYFVGVDNGTLSLIAQEIRIEEIFAITLNQNDFANDYLSVFVPVVCHLLRGGKPSIVGVKKEGIRELLHLKPVVTEQKIIIGTVVFIDNYGNVVTNIGKKLFLATQKQRDFVVNIRNHEFNTIVDSYSSVVKDFSKEEEYHGSTMVLFNSTGFLEISIYKSNPKTVGSASTLLGLKIGDHVKIEFN